jgi:hypothetical protein
MDQKAIEKSIIRLKTATKSVENMSSCIDQDAFVEIWYVFIMAYKNIWSTLERGAKISIKSKNWFENKRRVRQNDELLEYIYQSRNQEEHGLEPVSELVPGEITLLMQVPEDLKIDVSSFKIVNGLAYLRNGQKAHILEYQPPTIALISLKMKRNKSYPVPTQHLGNELQDSSPYNIAKLALIYMNSMVNEAKNLKYTSVD